MSRFATGERARIADRFTFGHSRVPTYARGQIGIIERVLRDFLIPEDDAFGRPHGRREVLYRVRLDPSRVWSDRRGPWSDTLELEIYELRELSIEKGADHGGRAPGLGRVLGRRRASAWSEGRRARVDRP